MYRFIGAITSAPSSDGNAGNWEWTDGSPVPQELIDWGPGQPNGNDQCMMVLRTGHNYQWYDAACDSNAEYRYICERSE